MAASTYTSLGVIAFWRGLQQVDLMNFYVGQLLTQSSDPATALLLGWHPWSVCRAAGFALISFEILSHSLGRLAGTPSAAAKKPRSRLLAGLALLTLDALLKATILEPVRQCLAANLV